MRRTARGRSRGRRLGPLLLGNATAPVSGGGGGDTEVLAALASLTLTENPAAVALDVAIAASVHALTLTGLQASLEIINEVAAGVAGLTLTENAAAIAFDRNVLASTTALTLTENVAGVLTSTDIPAVIYNGFSDYLKHTGGPAGASDGTTGTLVWCGEFQSDGSAQTLYDIPGTVPVLLQRQSDNTIDLVVGTSGAVASNSTAAVAASLGLLIVLASWSGTTSHLYVIHAAGTITGTNTPGSSDTVDLTADWYLGADGGAAAFLDANTSFWWADDAYIDFSDSDNREEFWDTTNDLPRDPGSDGSNPSGAQPLICHQSPSASHATNVGSGGDADAGSNSGDATSPGQWADDYVPATVSVELTDSDIDQTDLSEYTHASMAFGAADASRVIVVAIHGRTASVGVSAISGVTIGGVTATAAAFIDAGSAVNSVTAALYAAVVPTGTSGDVVVTWDKTQVREYIEVFRVMGIDGATASDSATNNADTGSAPAGTVTAVAGGVTIAASTATGNLTCTWTNATEVFDSAETFYAASAAADAEVTGGDTTITATWTGSGAEGPLVAIATWAPA